MAASTTEVFYSYAHKDERFRKKLETHLSNLKRQGLILDWHDRNISAGTDWKREIDAHLNTARLILLLISPDFMASEYCYSIEAKRAMERHEAGEAIVIPIILRPTDWNDVPFEKLQALPSDAKPITKWQNRDDAFLDVVKGIRKAIEELTTQISKVSFPSPLATMANERLEHLDGNMGLLQPLSHVLRHLDWGEAHYAEKFFGRKKELAQLEQWIVGNHCQVIAVVGIGGIGKTTLVKKLVERIKDEFEYVLWRSLQNAPSIEGILKDCIQFFSNQEQTSILGDIDSQITLLVKYLHEQRCLLVLDNVESILQAGDADGGYREGYEGYGKLISYLGEVAHQSCLLLTSREKPKEFTRLEGMASSVLSLTLLGMGQIEGREILKDKGLFGSNEEWISLINLYSGNPLALKLIASSIRDLFGGDIAKFLEEREIVFGDINDLLHEQYYRLSKREQEVMYWLAIEREPVALEDLREDIVRPLPKGALLEVLNSLQRRSMVERSKTAHFTLQPVITEYVTDELVKQAYEEIESETIEILASHALMKAQAKDYVRDSQIRLILTPLVEELLATMGKEGSEKKLKSMISTVREDHPHTPSYAAGNILNLLVQLHCDLRGSDFSHLVVWQAYLQGVALPAVNFAHSRFAKCVFTDTFGSILSVTLSPNGKLLAAGAANGEIRLWQVPSGTPQLVYQGHTDRVRSVVFNPSGDMLASCSEDLTVRLWDVSSGQCLKTLQGNSWIRSVAFSPDGSILASGHEDQTILLWNVNSGQCLKTLQGHSSWIRSVTFSPDGKVLASGSQDQTIRLWDVNTGQCLKTFQTNAKPIWSIAFSPDGRMLASGSEDQIVRLWDVNTGQCLKTLQGHSSWIRSIAFSPDGSVLASGSEDQTIRLWNVNTGQCVKTLQGHSSWIWSVAFSADGNTVVSGSDDQTVRLWEASTGQCLKTLRGHANRVRVVTFSPDSKILVSGSEDQIARLWNVDTGECFKMLRGHSSWICSAAFSPDGQILATGSYDHTIRFWDTSNSECLKILRGHANRVRSVAFSPDGNLLASGGEDQIVQVWKVSNGYRLNTLRGHTGQVWSVDFSPSGQILASGSHDQTIRFWDISSGRCLKTLSGHTNRVRSIAFSPNEDILASCGDDQIIRFWDISSGRCLKALQGHTNRVWSVAFSPDGDTLASGSHDQTILLWDTSTGRCLKTLQGHTDRIWSVAYSPNGRNLASAGDDGTIKLWNTQTGICFKTLRSDRPYENLNIIGVAGLTEAQKVMLKALGATEDEQEKTFTRDL